MLEFEVPVSEFFAVFGVNATYQKTDLSEIPIIAIFDFNYDRDQQSLGTTRIMSSAGKRKLGITVQKSEISSPRKDEKITVSDKTYIVEMIHAEDDISYYLIAREG